MQISYIYEIRKKAQRMIPVVLSLLLLLPILSSCDTETNEPTITGSNSEDDQAIVTITYPEDEADETPEIEPEETPIESEPEQETDQNGIRFPQLSALPRSFMESRLYGTLELVDGYLQVNGMIIVWEPGYSIQTENGTMKLYDNNGEVACQVGEDVLISGGEWIPENRLLTERLPQDITGPFWLQGEVIMPYTLPVIDTAPIPVTDNTTDTYTPIETTRVEEAMVKVSGFGERGVASSYGIVVGDGTRILTVLNYEEFTAWSRPLNIETASGEQYLATIVAIDPNSWVTMLELEDATLTPCTTMSADNTVPEQDFFLYGWDERIPVILDGINTYSNTLGISYGSERGPLYPTPGTPIADSNGTVIGMIGAYPYRSQRTSHLADIYPGKYHIEYALEQLNQANEQQIFREYPVVVFQKSSVFGWVGFGPNKQFLDIIYGLFNTLGEPLPIDPEEDLRFTFPFILNFDGNFLVMCFSYLQELKTPQGEVIARVKWVALNWNRSDGPNRILFGTDAYETESIYELTGDISALAALIN